MKVLSGKDWEEQVREWEMEREEEIRARRRKKLEKEAIGMEC